MRVIVFILSFLISLVGFSQFNLKTLNIITNDMVYDGVTDKLYVSIPSSNGANGNSIGVINPHTATLENTVFIGSEPTVLAISSDGQFIYSGFDGASKVVRFDLVTQSVGFDFNLGSHPTWGNLLVEDMKVSSDNPLNVIVARKSGDNNHKGVAFFDNGVMRTTTTDRWDYCNSLQFYDTDSVFAFNNKTSGFQLHKLAIVNVGVALVSSHQNVVSGFSTDFLYHDETIYTTNGSVIAYDGTFNLEGKFTGALGPVIYDAHRNKVCFASTINFNEIVFQRFNDSTFILEDSFEIPNSNGGAKKHVSCGNGCYAFNTKDDKVVILRETGVVGVNSIADKTALRIYPNPANEMLYLAFQKEIKQVFVYNVSGTKVMISLSPNNSISTEALPAGTYFLQVITESGESVYQKFLKE